MPDGTKIFTEKLNQCLDEMDAPVSVRERAVILSKILGITKQQAFSLLEGHEFPNSDLLEQMAFEFEVDINWLIGKNT